MVVACWDGPVYILLSVSLPNKELNVTLTSGSLEGSSGNTAPEVTSVHVSHISLQYRCQALGLVFRPTIGTLLPQKDPAQ